MPSRVDQLLALQDVCLKCAMCSLGWQMLDATIDPHVPGWLDAMSTLPKYMVIGQNPGRNEAIEKIPFVGSAGKYFDSMLEKHGSIYSINRRMFYITNVVKCLTYANKPPTIDNIKSCSPYLDIEITTVKPKFIIILGGVAFSALCPGLIFSDNISKVVATRYNIKAFVTYHPSPLNMQDESRAATFNRDMNTICKIIGRLESPF